uniref:Uncharacterized protein n=1 Tax=Oryza brachyantha TaxID=4533 RepID=J3N7T5_ORYBR
MGVWPGPLGYELEDEYLNPSVVDYYQEQLESDIIGFQALFPSMIRGFMLAILSFVPCASRLPLLTSCFCFRHMFSVRLLVWGLSTTMTTPSPATSAFLLRSSWGNTSGPLYIASTFFSALFLVALDYAVIAAPLPATSALLLRSS